MAQHVESRFDISVKLLHHGVNGSFVDDVLEGGYESVDVYGWFQLIEIHRLQMMKSAILLWANQLFIAG